jgi:hypothetical protein
MLALVACSNNDGFNNTGYVPYSYNYAPLPPGGYLPQAPPGSPIFQPQMPPGYPPQYYPFLPVDNYFRGQPQIMPYWTQTWNNWVGTAQTYGINPYDFTTFWYNYLPQVWSGGALGNLYNYLNSSVYSWMSPQTVFQTTVSVDYYLLFWNNYSGFGYNMNSCGCYLY